MHASDVDEPEMSGLPNTVYASMLPLVRAVTSGIALAQLMSDGFAVSDPCQCDSCNSGV